MDIKILSCFHKEFTRPSSNVIYPIHVGKDLSNLNMEMICDNKGDNISLKNPNYCELTALYWFWKNMKSDIVGLTHYRRYFDFRNGRYKNKKINYANSKILCSEMIKDYSKSIKNIFDDGYDIVLPKQLTFPMAVKHQYMISHIKEDYFIMEEIVREKYPEYADAFDYIFNKTNKIYAYNMFIMKYEEFCKYCEWLFSLLLDIESKVKISEYEYQSRIFGFMSERLLNVYVYKNNLKVKEVPIVFIDDNEIVEENFMKNVLKDFRNYIKFKL